LKTHAKEERSFSKLGKQFFIKRYCQWTRGEVSRDGVVKFLPERQSETGLGSLEKFLKTLGRGHL